MVWRRYRERCEESKVLADTITRLDVKYVKYVKYVGDSADVWGEVRGSITMLE